MHEFLSEDKLTLRLVSKAMYLASLEMDLLRSTITIEFLPGNHFKERILSSFSISTLGAVRELRNVF